MSAIVAWGWPDRAQRALDACVAAHGSARTEQAFTPHPTVARAPRRATAHSGVEDASAVQIAEPQCFTRIELMKSTQEQRGPRYKSVHVAELKGI
jgi:2'-5' RNA ligase